MGMTDIMVNCYEEEEMVQTTLEKATEFLIKYIRGYKDVGAHGVVIAEPAAGLISPDMSAEFAWPYVKQIVDAVQDDEFAVILRGRDYEQREALMGEMARHNAQGRSSGGAIVASGLAEYRPGEDDRVSAVYERADAMMYLDKKRLKAGVARTRQE